MLGRVGTMMVVTKYLPDKLFGFAEGSDLRVFFHLRVFTTAAFLPQAPYRCLTCPQAPRCQWGHITPPPILGEQVQVTVAEGSTQTSGQDPPATQVIRVAAPEGRSGVVETFDPDRGYGFILGGDDKSYHLHRSEILDGRLPIQGQRVVFYAGMREGRPRACHVRVC